MDDPLSSFSREDVISKASAEVTEAPATAGYVALERAENGSTGNGHLRSSDPGTPGSAPEAPVYAQLLTDDLPTTPTSAAAAAEAAGSRPESASTPTSSAAAGSRPASASTPKGAAAAGGVHPPDPLDQDTLGQLLQQASPSAPEPPRFSMTDFMKNMNLHQAARRELEGSAIPGPSADSAVAALDSNGHEAEIERQRAALRELDREVCEEGVVNVELIKLMLERLESGKQALDGVVQLVSTLVQLESQRSSSLSASAKLPLTGPSDGASLMASAATLQQLPLALASHHGQLQAAGQGLLEPLVALQKQYGAASKDLNTRRATVQRAVQTTRRQLGTLFQAHVSACLAFDEAMRGANSGRGPLLSRLDADPWDTEGRLVAEQRTLMLKQEEERTFVAEALTYVAQLEGDRVTAVITTTRQLLELYCRASEQLPGALVGLVPSSDQVAAVVSAAPGQMADLERMALDTRAASSQLAARQATALEDVVQELFCSPEITRQGEMERWDPRTSTWSRRHFVLTRAGYLHCYERMSDAARCDVLKLSRCEVEQGEAPVINLIEGGIASWLTRGSRKLVLKASSVEEYCEWALALREAIAVATNKRGSAAGR